jgi:hypothetical protein
MRHKESHIGFGKSFEQVLSQAQFKRSLGTPMLKPAPAGAKAVGFECLGDRAFPVDLASVSKADSDFFAAWDRKENLEALALQFNNQVFLHDYYKFEFKARCLEPDIPNEPVILCHPKEKSMGEDLQSIQKPDSLFRKKLQTIEKGHGVVILRVWSDSFKFFRDLREWLQSEGYQIRWDPVDKPLALYNPRYSGKLEID